MGFASDLLRAVYGDGGLLGGVAKDGEEAGMKEGRKGEGEVKVSGLGPVSSRLTKITASLVVSMRFGQQRCWSGSDLAPAFPLEVSLGSIGQFSYFVWKVSRCGK